MDAQETISSIYFSDLYQQNKEKKQDLVRIGEYPLKVEAVYNFQGSTRQKALKHAAPQKVMTPGCSRISNITRTSDCHCSFTNPALVEAFFDTGKMDKSGVLKSYLGAES